MCCVCLCKMSAAAAVAAAVVVVRKCILAITDLLVSCASAAL